MTEERQWLAEQFERVRSEASYKGNLITWILLLAILGKLGGC